MGLGSLLATLSLTVFDGFGGTQLSCKDGNAEPDEAEMQTITATVFGEDYVISVCHAVVSKRLSVL